MSNSLTFALMDAPFENSRTVTMFRINMSIDFPNRSITMD